MRKTNAKKSLRWKNFGVMLFLKKICNTDLLSGRLGTFEKGNGKGRLGGIWMRRKMLIWRTWLW